MSDNNALGEGLLGDGITVHDAIVSRRSVRAYKGDPVDPDIIAEILKVASRAPSGINTQPWNVHVFTGGARQELCDVTLKAYWNEPENHTEDRLHYMDPWREPYQARKRKIGWDMYGLMGIEKGEREKMLEARSRNYTFFDAPVGLIFTIDSDLGWMSWLDCGAFIQNIAILARNYGLHTCAQAAWATYHKVIDKHLNLKAPETVFCGMCLGYEDTTAPVNSLRTERAHLDSFATFHMG